eukprot:5345504-Ditylum_brightwellii.AAC.1
MINLDSSDSDDSSVFIPREAKKEKYNKGKGEEKRKYFYDKKKSNTQNKSTIAKKEVDMSKKSKKDVEIFLMHKKQTVQKQATMKDPGV